jgi:hypothetical protein
MDLDVDRPPIDLMRRFCSVAISLPSSLMNPIPRSGRGCIPFQRRTLGIVLDATLKKVAFPQTLKHYCPTMKNGDQNVIEKANREQIFCVNDHIVIPRLNSASVLFCSRFSPSPAT